MHTNNIRLAGLRAFVSVTMRSVNTRDPIRGCMKTPIGTRTRFGTGEDSRPALLQFFARLCRLRGCSSWFLIALTILNAEAALPKRALVIHSFIDAAPLFTAHSA